MWRQGEKFQIRASNTGLLATKACIIKVLGEKWGREWMRGEVLAKQRRCALFLDSPNSVVVSQVHSLGFSRYGLSHPPASSLDTGDMRCWLPLLWGWKQININSAHPSERFDQEWIIFNCGRVCMDGGRGGDGNAAQDGPGRCWRKKKKPLSGLET